MNFQPYRDISLGQLLTSLATTLPDRVALLAGDRSWTFAQLESESRSVARALVALGVAKGDRVAVWSGNIPEWILLQFALAKLGAILVTVNIALRSHELGYLLQQSGTSVFFCVPKLRQIDTLAELAAAGPLPGLRHVVLFQHSQWDDFLAGGQDIREKPSEIGRSDTFEQSKASSGTYPAVSGEEVTLDDCINMQYTSGTTGFPKGVRLSSRNIVNNGYWLGQGLGYTPEDRLCLCVPLFHCFGCVIGVLASFTHGVSLALVEYFEPLQVLETIQRHGCTALYGVPTMFLAQLEHPEFARFNLSSLRTGVMAGSLCPEPLMRRVMGEMHLREMTIAYGLTESSPAITMTPRHDSVELRSQTVGRVLPELEVKLSPEGELWVRGYNVMEGYHENPEATAAALDQDGWLRTGDQASIDQNGYVRIIGRIKDTIIRGGENIAPSEVEDRLRQHPAILDVAVYGVPCNYYGEAVAAAIRLRSHLTPEEIQAYCKEHLAHFKVPRQIRFMDEFPLTASGKIQKFRLREQHQG